MWLFDVFPLFRSDRKNVAASQERNGVNGSSMFLAINDLLQETLNLQTASSFLSETLEWRRMRCDRLSFGLKAKEEYNGKSGEGEGRGEDRKENGGYLEGLKKCEDVVGDKGRRMERESGWDDEIEAE